MNNILEVLVGGKPIRQFAQSGRTYIEGRKGQEFSLRIRNNHAARKLFNVTIDGINVLDGKTDGSTQGYVLAGYSSYEVKGFRTSNSEVASFKFNEKSKSYANKAGDFSTQNCGIIGLRVFNEVEQFTPTNTIINQQQYIHYIYPNYIYPNYEQHWWYPPYMPTWTCSSKIESNTSLNGQGDSASFSNIVENVARESSNNIGLNANVPQVCNYMSVSNPEPQPSFSLGTEWGDKKTDIVSDTEFSTGTLLEQVEIYYGTLDDLIRMNVDVRKEVKVAFPQAFPDKRFCQPPK